MDSQPMGSRRDFLRLLGVGALAACAPPREKILPYVKQPWEIQPGLPLHYASSMPLDGYAFGVLVESHQGRPTKIEGNPEHPASVGATSAVHQAAIFDLYDPARAVLPRAGSYAREVELLSSVETGEGLHVVLEPTASPLIHSLLERVRSRFPEVRFHFHSSLPADGAAAGSTIAFGRMVEMQRRLDRARVVLSVGGDLFSEPPDCVRLSRDFANVRRVRSGDTRSTRLHALEADLSLAGAIADHRRALPPGEIPRWLAAVAVHVFRALGDAPAALREAKVPQTAADDFARQVARDLIAHPGASAIVVGQGQPAEAHAIAHALDVLLGNVGQTALPTAPLRVGMPGLDALASALGEGSVGTLLFLEVDPVGDGRSELAALVPHARRSICLDGRNTATARACGVFLPGLHWLEAWGDGRSFDGTITLQQPLIRPLYGGNSAAMLLAALAGDRAPDIHRAVRALHAGDDEARWTELLRRGFVPDTAATPAAVELDAAAIRGALERIAAAPPAEGWAIVLRPDRKVRDGRFSGNDWLLELPDPITRQSWGNAALLSPESAASLGVEEGDPLEIRVGDRVVEAPALPLPGIAPKTLVLPLGWGQRHRSEGVVGVDASPLRTRASPWHVSGAAVTRGAGPRQHLAIVQRHLDMHERPILLEATLEQFRTAPQTIGDRGQKPLSLYPNPWKAEGVQWGMAIDLDTCIGCAACVIACQAENNVPVVGSAGVRKGREMHWLRIDRYLNGQGDDDVRLLPQPMLCQHCEKAPCEYVCPVNATVHSPDGLNEMVYNRCVGTRFCSNNCPYKVRRFNWFDFNEQAPETLQMQKNPDVTVRARGVMEKCTYCVQRIRTAQIDARLQGKPLRDGDVRTACQQACPTEAIVFGAVSDPDSQVSRMQAEPHAYGVLDQELGTWPRTRYLARLRNVGPGGEGG